MSHPPSATQSRPILALTDVVKTYKGSASPAVAGVSLQLRTGSCLGLLGPNGAGKTTLISMVCGLLKPDSGNLTLDGEAITGTPTPGRHRLGLVPQDIALYPSLTARENLRFFGAMAGLQRKVLEERIECWLEKLGLAQAADKRIETFSGGMKRRCNIIAATLANPALVVLDEPTAGVDPQSRALIHRSLQELNRLGTSLLVTTHLIAEAEALCDDIIILDEGRIIASGSPRTLIENVPGAGNLDDVFLHHTGHALRD